MHSSLPSIEAGLQSVARGMRSTAFGGFWNRVSLARDGCGSLQGQLYEQIREGIVCGLLLPGARLPGSRTLAAEIACSRNTVLEVYEQLADEGYVVSVRGSGVYVAQEVPDRILRAQDVPAADASPISCGELSARGRSIGSVRMLTDAPEHTLLSSALPDVSLFPADLWMQLLAREWRDRSADLMRNVDPRGYAPLRAAIAEFVFSFRNVACSPEQIFVVSNTAQAIDLIARFQLDAGNRAWIEDPGDPAISSLLRSLGADVIPVGLDDQGLSLFAERDAAPRLIVVSPAHQFPTGIAMSHERRLELLEYAASVDAWIVEDDRDSEFRYFGRPMPALAALHRPEASRVFYVGGFSKMMFPAMHIGFIVVPMHLTKAFAAAHAVTGQQPSILPQPALARFIAEGHLARHLRRMRPIYRHRHDTLVEAIGTRGAGLFVPPEDPSGMFCLARFTPELAAQMSDVDAATALRRHEIDVQPLSSLFRRDPKEQGLVLGFACGDERTIVEAADRMFETLRG